MLKLSVNEFQKKLKEEIKTIAQTKGWNLDKETERGFAFQLWVASLVAGFEPLYETPPEDAMTRSPDLKADLVFEDTTSNRLLICQCKYQKLDSVVDETEVNDCFNRHDHYMDRAWVVKHASTEARRRLQDYRELVLSGWSVVYYFVTTARATQRVRELAERCNAEYSRKKLPITCELYDFEKLKEYYVKAQSLEESIPEEVTLDLPTDQFLEKDEPYPTLIAVLKGNTLRNLAKQHKQALFAWNIRGYLGSRGINEQIGVTAKDAPADFFYFNNGVSAICTDYSLENNHLVAKHLQIINGSQTVSTLANLEANAEIEVLFRLTRTKSVTTEKGFNRDLIQYNNSQNAVKLSDFRSNDPIQRWLEKTLSEQKPKGALPAVHYVRKRAVGRKGIGRGIRLEEFAKLRYSFLKEPTLIHSSPKLLWTLREDGGNYEDAFGVEGEVESSWSNDTLDETLLALALYLRVDEMARSLARENPDYSYLPRLRFHLLSLLAEYFRIRVPRKEWNELRRDLKKFDEMWSRGWDIAKDIVVDSFEQAEADEMTTFSFVRSSEKWEKMKKRVVARTRAIR